MLCKLLLLYAHFLFLRISIHYFQHELELCITFKLHDCQSLLLSLFQGNEINDIGQKLSYQDFT